MTRDVDEGVLSRRKDFRASEMSLDARGNGNEQMDERVDDSQKEIATTAKEIRNDET